MQAVREKIELFFKAYGHFVVRRRWPALAVILIFAGGIISMTPRLTMDLSAEGLLHKTDPALITYEQFRDQFGRDQMVVIGLDPVEIFSFSFLDNLKKFHRELQEIPHVEEVTSLINAPATLGVGDTLLVEDFLDTWPESGDDLALLEQRALADPLYRDLLISADGSFTLVVVRPDVHGGSATDDVLGAGFDDEETGASAGGGQSDRFNEDDMRELVDGVLAVAERYRSPDFPLHIGGAVMVEELMKRVTSVNMKRFLVLSSLLIVCFLTILFRRVSGVALPLLVVNLSLASTLGLMAMFGAPITLNSQILPSFMLAVGIGDSVHVLVFFYRRFSERGDKEEAIAYSLGHAGLALVMTSLTTAGGLLSFASVGIAPIAQLGIFAASGVLLALVYTLVLLPALLAILPISRKQPVMARTLPSLDRTLARLGNFACSRPGLVLGGAALILLVTFYSALQLKFSHSSITYLPKGSEVRTATHLIDSRMRGSLNLEILVDTGRENGLYDPAVMAALDESARFAEGVSLAGISLGRAMTVADRVKDINQALHQNSPADFVVPNSRQLIAQELLLYENSGGDDLDRQVDGLFRKARLSIRGPWVDAMGYIQVVALLREKMTTLFGDRATITVTGITNLMCRTFAAIIHSMAVSYLIAGVVITMLMILMLGDIRLGLLSMIPNFFPIVTALGVMYWLNMPLDVSSVMIGSIAIGLAVDDTVHFMHHFRTAHQQLGDVRAAVQKTLTTAGRAMLFTTMILCAGFFVLMLSSQRNLQHFGFIAGFTIIVALAADLLVSPALMAVIYRNPPGPPLIKGEGVNGEVRGED